MSVSDVRRARDLERGVVCLSGTWVGDEIVLRDYYLEDTLDPDIIDAGNGLGLPLPPIGPDSVR